LKRQPGDLDQDLDIVCIASRSQFLVREIVLLCQLRDASLQAAFDRIARQLVRPRPLAGRQKSGGIATAILGELLKLRSVHVFWLS
jgi:hypothetical protein